MDYNAILDRILDTVDHEAYRYTGAHLTAQDAEAQAAVHAGLADDSVDVATIRALVERMHADGSIDDVVRLSLLYVIAAHPRVKDYQEAARLTGEREFAAWRRGGSDLQAQLAGVDRHRGALAFLLGHYEQALDHFARALERERTPNNLQNVLATLLRLGEETDARNLLVQIRSSYPKGAVDALEGIIQQDPDLALLR